MSKINSKIPVFIFLILACLPVLSPSCSGKELITEKQVIAFHDVFEDENENWKARYELNETHVFIKTNRKTHHSLEEISLFSIYYKGNLSDLPSLKQFNLSYNTGFGGSGWSGQRVEGPPSRNMLDGIINREHVDRYSTGSSQIKEQKPIFKHTIGPICAPYNTVYIHNEASGGTKVGKNDTVKVTIELDGETEILELKSA
ncbi:hypothetical protein ACSAZK_02290 [Methanosarcina sp. Mfa9]|uniref:hypothetical protein n=1 Tax=Methanosarcina sp. Mfa9 TaxID=3439063 RepID=UPI003F87D358